MAGAESQSAAGLALPYAAAVTRTVIAGDAASRGSDSKGIKYGGLKVWHQVWWAEHKACKAAPHGHLVPVGRAQGEGKAKQSDAKQTK